MQSNNTAGKKVSLFLGLRIDRGLMLGLVSSSTAFGFGAPYLATLLLGIAGMLLSVGGFLTDYAADYEKDRSAGRVENPFVGGRFPFGVGLGITAACFASGLGIAGCVSPWLLIPSGFVLLLCLGLASGFLDTPLGRAFTLGGLQSCYVFLGGLAGGGISISLVCTALFLFFAMTGGRVLGDVRDLPQDEKAGTDTMPRRYGLPFCTTFLIINEAASYICALASFFTGSFRPGYLYCLIGIVIGGIGINTFFLLGPTPKRADLANRLSFMMLGGLYVLGMFLGRV
jgi:4-hydroxybenzoate polyprenyltransferase